MFVFVDVFMMCSWVVLRCPSTIACDRPLHRSARLSNRISSVGLVHVGDLLYSKYVEFVNVVILFFVFIIFPGNINAV